MRAQDKGARTLYRHARLNPVGFPRYRVSTDLFSMITISKHTRTATQLRVSANGEEAVGYLGANIHTGRALTTEGINLSELVITQSQSALGSRNATYICPD